MSVNERSDHTSPVANGRQAHHEPQQHGFWRSRSGFVAILFLSVAAFFLIYEHWAHALGILPYLVILVCPLLHLFMHRGHGGHDGHSGHAGDKPGQGDRHTPSKEASS